MQLACTPDTDPIHPMLQAALSAGCDPNAIDPQYGLTPLVMATVVGDIQAVEMLMDAGAHAFTTPVGMRIRLDEETHDFEEFEEDQDVGTDGKLEYHHSICASTAACLLCEFDILKLMLQKQKPTADFTTSLMEIHCISPDMVTQTSYDASEHVSEVDVQLDEKALYPGEDKMATKKTLRKVLFAKHPTLLDAIGRCEDIHGEALIELVRGERG